MSRNDRAGSARRGNDRRAVVLPGQPGFQAPSSWGPSTTRRAPTTAWSQRAPATTGTYGAPHAGSPSPRAARAVWSWTSAAAPARRQPHFCTPPRWTR